MTYAHIDVRPISGALGAEIHGVDLSKDLSGAVIEEIRSAWLEHLVIFFRQASDGHGHETHYFQSFVAERYSKNAPPIATRLNPMDRYTGWAGSFCKSADTVM